MEALAGCSEAAAAGAGRPPMEGGCADPDGDTGSGAGGDAVAAGVAGAADGGDSGDAEGDRGGTGPTPAWPHYAQNPWTGS